MTGLLLVESYQLGVLAVAVPLIGAALVPLFGCISSRTRAWFAVFIGFITACITLALVYRIQIGVVGEYNWIPLLNIKIGLILDGISVAVALIAGVIGCMTVLFSVKYMEHAEHEGYSLSRYYSLVLLFIASMIGLALSNNLIILYIFWELVGFCSYALIAYYYRDPKATWAGWKAFVTTRIGDTGLLIGILIFWWTLGTVNINEIIVAVSAGEVSKFALGAAGIGFILAAIGKSAQVPLHVWLPDAMEAPTTISALIHAATMVNAGVYLIARSYPIFIELGWWLLAVAWIGAITAFLTATMALAERDLKRVLAYSTISQLGYMMTAIGAGAVLASQFHLFSHAIFKALLFLCAGAVIHTIGTRNMYEMGGLAEKMRWTHICFTVGILALIGIPIFNGFWSKDLVLAEIYHAGLYGPLILLILGAFATAGYSMRMYWLVFRGKPRAVVTKSGRDWEASVVARGGEITDAPWEMTTVLIMLALGTTFSWILLPMYSFGFEISLSPIYEAKFIPLSKFIIHTLTDPMFIVTVLIIILVAYLAYSYRDKLEHTFREPTGINKILSQAYGFDLLYGSFTAGIRSLAQDFRKIQTGDLNYNLIYFAIGLICILLLIMWRGGL